MADIEQPQLYLITPQQFDLAAFGPRLNTVLAAHEIACVRLALTSTDEVEITRAADGLREICHAHDVALIVTDHFRLVEPLGLDGCHLSDGPRQVRDVRKLLGAEAIVGAGCGTSKHSGLSAAESGADYVSFGPMAASNLGDGDVADIDLFTWWSEMIEVPIVAEGGLDTDIVQKITSVTDFLAFGDEIWNSDDPSAALSALL